MIPPGMTRPAARVGDTCAIHDCTVPVIVTGSRDVLINGRGAARQGDSTQVHVFGPKCEFVHSSSIGGGSSKVMINGRPAARRGDSTCRPINSGSPDVLIA